MLAATLKAITWATVATAVVSAFWLASDGDGDGLLRTARSPDEAAHRSAATPTAAPTPAQAHRPMPATPARADSPADRY